MERRHVELENKPSGTGRGTVAAKTHYRPPLTPPSPPPPPPLAVNTYIYMAETFCGVTSQYYITRSITRPQKQ